MPHVTIKLWPGSSEPQKKRLADAIVKDFGAVLGTSQSSLSVAIEEVSPQDWMDKVYRPDIEPNMASLYKKPGYKPF
jgi:4-oxalocrotonate tautomerase